MDTNGFCKKHGISAKVSRCARNPNMGEWKDANHYLVVLEMDGDFLQVFFSQGLGIKRGPKSWEVLDCLLSDSCGVENADNFESWAEEYGYDSDSRTAEGIYQTVQEQREELKSFLGDEFYQEGLYETERL